MNYLLHIDTSRENASVCLTAGEELLNIRHNNQQQDHAAWLHKAVQDMLDESSLQPAQLQAIAVTLGPGSYTGLRVGLAAAKGFCYALQRPLITVNTLLVMAAAVREEAGERLIIPMIDARRMEVFTAVYGPDLEEIRAPHSRVLTPESLEELAGGAVPLFCGSGSRKLHTLPLPPRAHFSEREGDAATLAKLAWKRFRQQEFSDLAYTDPLYLKAFYTGKAN